MNMCVVEVCTCEKVPHNVHVLYIGYRREHVENLRIVDVRVTLVYSTNDARMNILRTMG